MTDAIEITLYRWAGRKLFWEIGSECAECDDAVQTIRELLENDFPNSPIRFEIKNWLDYLGEALQRGGWHPPVTVVNGRRFCQGVVPDRDRLRQTLARLLAEPSVKRRQRECSISSGSGCC